MYKRPLLGRFDPAAPKYIVVFRDGFDGVAETKRLADKYGFTPSDVWSFALDGFAALQTDGIVARLRCEPGVANIAHDAVARTAWLPPFRSFAATVKVSAPGVIRSNPGRPASGR